ncbi:MAG: lipid-A-disaccharide synthase N-terminal domain-containing protein [Chthoniobacterales bacterium]
MNFFKNFRNLITLALLGFGLAACQENNTFDWHGAGRLVDPAIKEKNASEIADLKVRLPAASEHVQIAQLPDGMLVFIIQPDGMEPRMLTPDEFTKILHDQQINRNWLLILLNISSPIGIAWVALGLGGQILFTGRMLVQWIISERDKRSVIPVAFWWMSLFGASMLMIYFIWRKDIVGVIGQGTGWFIYIRNLMLIYKKHPANP